MKQPLTNRVAISNALYVFRTGDKTNISIANSTDLYNNLPVASMGNFHRDAKGLSILLQNISSGNNTHHKDLNPLECKYGAGSRSNYHYSNKRQGEV